MEHYKVSKLLNDSYVSNFVTKKWVEVNDLSSGQYSVNKNIRFKTYIFAYIAYIVVKGTITVEGTNDANKRNKKLTFKNNSSFRLCISKINGTLIDSAEDLNIAIPMYNLFEYCESCSMTSGTLWNCYREEINDDANNYRINNKKTTTSKSFEYKTKIIVNAPDNENKLNAEVVTH